MSDIREMSNLYHVYPAYRDEELPSIVQALTNKTIEKVDFFESEDGEIWLRLVFFDGYELQIASAVLVHTHSPS